MPECSYYELSRPLTLTSFYLIISVANIHTHLKKETNINFVTNALIVIELV